MVKINFRFTSPGIKVLGLIFSPWKTSRAKLRSDNGYVVEMPILPWKRNRRALGSYIFSSQLEGNNGSRRCMPPQGEVKHLLKGGRKMTAGSLITATALAVGRHPSLMGRRWRWHGSDKLWAWEWEGCPDMQPHLRGSSMSPILNLVRFLPITQSMTSKMCRDNTSLKIRYWINSYKKLLRDVPHQWHYQSSYINSAGMYFLPCGSH